jgi:glycine betaine/proline transport system substrate-binding protein
MNKGNKYQIINQEVIMSFKYRFWMLCILVGIAIQSIAYCNDLQLGYTNDSTSIITSNVVKAVLVEKLGTSVKMTAYPVDKLWGEVATGNVDVMVSAWLPQSHAALLKKYKGQIEILKPVTLGVTIGLVTPTYVTINRLDQFNTKKSRFKNNIYCIKGHIGSIEMTKRAIAAYSLKKVKCVELTEQQLIKKIEDCSSKLEWIALGVWTPHIIFSQWKLKFLQDPKDVFSKDEQIVAISKPTFKKDERDAYAFLKKFYCSPKEIQEMMNAIIKLKNLPMVWQRNIFQKIQSRSINGLKMLKKVIKKDVFISNKSLEGNKNHDAN